MNGKQVMDICLAAGVEIDSAYADSETISVEINGSVYEFEVCGQERLLMLCTAAKLGVFNEVVAATSANPLVGFASMYKPGTPQALREYWLGVFRLQLELFTSQLECLLREE